MKMYEVYEPVQTVDWEKDTLVEGESFFVVCEEHKSWCNDDTRFEEIESSINMCRFCSFHSISS